MRAIISAWKSTAPELADREVWPILQKLTNTLPHYCLPNATVSHTRHYMPTRKKTLIMDTFVAAGDPVHVIWRDVTLDGKEVETLNKILRNLHYFGRAESWCSVLASNTAPTHNCGPAGDQELPSGTDSTYVLVPKRNVKFIDTFKQGSKPDAALDSISVTTRELQDHKYSDPPGGEWVRYYLPRNCFEERLPHRTTAAGQNAITMVRYAVVGAVRPRIWDTLRIGDRTRTACMSKYGESNGGRASRTFSGKDERGLPLVGHKHAFYLPTYEAQNSEIDHITVVAPEGFNAQERIALFSMTKLYGRNLPDVNLVFQGCGRPDDFSTIPILGKARRWVSATPLILSRHAKHRGKGADRHLVDGPKEQIRAEIKNRYGESYELKRITINDSLACLHNTSVRPHEFFRWRRRGRVGDGKTYNVQLEFQNPVAGPIALGYASHYGLGMFVPAEEQQHGQ